MTHLQSTIKSIHPNASWLIIAPKSKKFRPSLHFQWSLGGEGRIFAACACAVANPITYGYFPLIC